MLDDGAGRWGEGTSVSKADLTPKLHQKAFLHLVDLIDDSYVFITLHIDTFKRAVRHMFVFPGNQTHDLGVVHTLPGATRTHGGEGCVNVMLALKLCLLGQALHDPVGPTILLQYPAPCS